VTFVPCFLFILLGAPYVERLRGNVALSSALTGVTAAVVGVIGNLALYFAMHTLFGDVERVAAGPLDFELPRLGSLRESALAITLLGLGLLYGRGWSVLRTLGVCAVVGAALHLAINGLH
jgi:chromate transporter